MFTSQSNCVLMRLAFCGWVEDSPVFLCQRHQLRGRYFSMSEPITKHDEANARLNTIRSALLSRFNKEKSPKHALLEQAVRDAEYHHRDQFRKSGEPVIIHPFRVALLVSEAGMDVEAVIIALLHDVIEDTEFTKSEIEEKYGVWLADVVDGLTKVATKKTKRPATPDALATYRKLLSSTVKDLRTLQVKIFDRLDNMRDLGFLNRNSQRRISAETLNVYVPMAQRLGLREISDELTTLCFRYLYPKRFKKTLSHLKERIREERKKSEGITRALAEALSAMEGEANVKPHYHLVCDYLHNTQPVSKALVSIKIRVPDLGACYAAMGILHQAFRVVPNTIRDYISNPKPNRHQWLESQIFLANEHVTIELFSAEMERINLHGILADWRSSREELSRYYESYLDLLDRFSGDEDLRMEDVLRYGEMDSLQLFTPQGKVLSFPQRATILDFAFAIHTDLGLHCEGALIGGRRVSPFEELKEGEMVEVLSSPGVLPRPQWLGQVRTTRAKLAIRRFLRTQQLDRAEEVGRSLFFADLQRLGLDPTTFPARPDFRKALRRRKLKEQQFYQKLGTRELYTNDFLLNHELVDKKQLEKLEGQTSRWIPFLKPRKSKTDPDLKISHVGDDFIHLAACCAPLPGDRIKGERQPRSILVHREECKVLESVPARNQVTIGWEKTGQRHGYRLTIQVKNRPGQIYKIGKIMRDLKVNIHDLSVEQLPEGGHANIKVLLEPIDLQTFQKIVTRMRSSRDVVKIH